MPQSQGFSQHLFITTTAQMSSNGQESHQIDLSISQIQIWIYPCASPLPHESTLRSAGFTQALRRLFQGSLKELEIQLIRWPPPTLVWCCRSSCPPHMRTMVLVYLPTKLGDFVRANVGKYSIHGAYVGQELGFHGTKCGSTSGQIHQKSPNPIEIMGPQLEISIHLGCVAKKLENSTTATSMELSTKGMVLKLQIWYSHL